MSIFFLFNSQGDSLKTNLATVPRDYELIQVTDFFSGKMNQNYHVACSFFSIKTSPVYCWPYLLKREKKC